MKILTTLIKYIFNNLPQSLLPFWILGIFVACVFGRKIQNRIEWTIYFIPYIGLLLLVMATLCFAIWYKHRLKTRPNAPSLSLKTTILLIAVTIINCMLAVVIAQQFIQLPIEAIHMVKYASLSFILFFCIKSKNYLTRFLFAFLVGAIIGCSEETIQIWIPARFFDYRDLGFNIVSCLFGAWHALTSRIVVTFK